MKRLLVLLAPLGALAALAPSPASADVVRFKNGDILQGEVVESDQQWFKFRRYDTGGLVTISWDQLHPDDRAALRRSLRLEGTEEEEGIRVEGVRLHLTSGETVEGLLEKQTASGDFTLRTTAGLFNYGRKQIERHEKALLDALLVYTKAQAYDWELARRRKAGEPVTGAPGHFGLGEFCIKIRHYAKAKEHLSACAAADPAHEAEAVKNLLGRLEGLIRDAEAQDLYDAVEKLIANKKFVEANAAWKSLADKFPESEVVKQSAEGITGKIEAKRTEYLNAQVPLRWFGLLRKLLTDRSYQKQVENPENKVKEDFTLAHAKNFSRKAVGKEVGDGIAGALGIAADEVRTIFAGRKSFDYKRANYGSGTFIVEKSSLPIAGASSGNVADQLGKLLGGGKATAEDLKRFLPQGQQQGKGQQLETADQWWNRQQASDRFQWMMAFYAENSGEMVIVRIESPACSGDCAGKGYYTYLTPGAEVGGTKYAICPRCHGVGHDRVVVFK